MSNLLVVPDLHGKDIWKRAVNEIEHDEVVFLGDYFDSFDIDGNTQLENFADIIEFKTSRANKVVLLAGNHDINSYVFGDTASGHQKVFAPQISNALKKAWDLKQIQACHVVGDYLFIHAGLTYSWLDSIFPNTEIHGDDVENLIGNLFWNNPKMFNFAQRLSADIYGDNIWQSPFWIRPTSLIKDKFKGFTQVVGHTAMDKINYSHGVWFTDCLDTVNQFLVVKDGKVEIVNL